MVQKNLNKQKIIDLRSSGLSYGAIAKMVGLSRARIHQICSGYKNPQFSVEAQKIHNNIFLRDDLRCQWGIKCKDRLILTKDLVVHYIDFNNKNNSSDNLITLCRFCHSYFHSRNHIDEKIEKNLAINKERKTRICLVCKKEFIPPTHSNRKTCSNKCASYHWEVAKKSPEEREKMRRASFMRYYNKIKNTSEFKSKQNKYHKKYYIKNREELDEKSARALQRRINALFYATLDEWEKDRENKKLIER